MVQAVHRPPAPILRHIDQIVGEQDTGVRVRFWQGPPRRRDVDVVHVADEDLDDLLKFSARRPVRRLMVALLLLAMLRAGRIALVRSIGPTRPTGEPGMAAAITRRILASATTAFITVDATDSTIPADRRIVIPHAHFRDRFVGYPRAAEIRGRVLWVSGGGNLDDALPSVASDIRSDEIVVHVVWTWSALPPKASSTFPADRVPGLHARREQLSDGSFVHEIDSSELVVVPATDTREQLQAVFLALSLDRPVLTRRTASMSSLADEVGGGWLHLTETNVGAADIDGTLSTLRRADRTTPPFLDGRDLASTQAAYAAAFRRAAGMARPT